MKSLLIGLIILSSLWSVTLYADTTQADDIDTIEFKQLINSVQDNDNIAQTLEDVAEYVVENSNASEEDPFTVKMFSALFILISIFLLLMLVLPIVVGLNNLIRIRIGKLHAQTEAYYKPLIFEYLSQSDKNPPIPILNRRFHRVNKPLLSTILYELSLYVRGEDRRKLERLYQAYHLDRFLIKKISSPFVWFKSFYLKMFSVFEPTPGSIVVLERLAHHRNSQIRLYSIQAIIRLDPRRVIGLFYAYKYKLSLWEQINYHDFFVTNDIAVPNFHPLTLSKNDTVVMFALRMIRIFDQRQGTIKGYEWLLRHPNLSVQIEMFRSLAEFEYENMSELLSELVPRSNPYIRTHIITYLSRKNYATTELLMQYYRDNTDYDLRLHILYCIYNFIEGGKKDIIAFTNQTEDVQLQKLSCHLLNNVL
ncbi:MAG: HEAT repeat domain-containing protein [Muribaculaceae bacterium]